MLKIFHEPKRGRMRQEVGESYTMRSFKSELFTKYHQSDQLKEKIFAGHTTHMRETWNKHRILVKYLKGETTCKT